MKKILLYVFLFGFYFVYPQLEAFPGASGFGKNVSGGRGGTVYVVSNLNSSGTGSLKAAVETSGARTIIFSVAGKITADLNISNDDMTILGETAPGDGITLEGTVSVTANNILVRNIHFRMPSSAYGSGLDAVTVRSFGTKGDGVIFDHCTFSWGEDECFNTTNYKNVTVSNSIIGPPGNGTYAWLITTDSERVSSIRNYYVRNNDRTPLVGSPTGLEELVTYLRSENINNVFYANQSHTFITYGLRASFIGNSYKDSNGRTFQGYEANVIAMTTSGEVGSMRPNTEIYIDDNEILNPGTQFDNGSISRGLYSSSVLTYEVETPTESSGFTSLPANEIVADLLPTVGPIQRVAYDQDLIDDYYTGDVPRNDMTIGTLDAGTPYTDSDADNLWDVAEIAIWGSIGVASSATSYTNGTSITDYDAWTNIEKVAWYLSGSEGSSGSGGFGGGPTDAVLKTKFFNKKKRFF